MRTFGINTRDAIFEQSCANQLCWLTNTYLWIGIQLLETFEQRLRNQGVQHLGRSVFAHSTSLPPSLIYILLMFQSPRVLPFPLYYRRRKINTGASVGGSISTSCKSPFDATAHHHLNTSGQTNHFAFSSLSRALVSRKAFQRGLYRPLLLLLLGGHSLS